MRGGERVRRREIGREWTARRHAGAALRGALWAATAAALLGAGCEPWARLGDLKSPSRPTASVLMGSEIALVTTRFAGEPAELYSGASRYRLRISFDPQLVDLTRLKACGLWAQDHVGGPWKRLGTFAAKREAVATTFAPRSDGAYGLRVSAIYTDDAEVLVPTQNDRPLVWLNVDRTAPKLTWISPAAGTPVSAGQALDLVWGASEMCFGDAPVLIEWSQDGGASWMTVDRAKPARGTAELRFRVPAPGVTGSRAPLVRVTAWDLVGNRSSAVLPLALPEGGRPPAAGPEGGALAAGEASADSPAAAGEATSVPAPVEAASLATPLPALHREESDAAEAVHAPSRAEGAGKAAARPLGPDGGSAQGPLILRNWNDGAVHPGGVTRYIFFALDGLDPERTRVTIEWQVSPGGPWSLVAPGVPAREGKHLWKLPEVTTSEGKLRLTAIEAAGPAGKTGTVPAAPSAQGRKAVVESFAPIRLDSLAPIAEVRGIRRGADGSPLVSLNCFDRGPAGLAEVELFVTSDGGATYQTLAVADPTQPVAVSLEAPRLGFRVAARDRVGNATPRPQAGTPPQETFERGGEASLEVESLEGGLVRGGEQRYVGWRFQGPRDLQALVEASRDGGGSWEPVAEVPAAAGKALWIAPAENCTALIRVRVRHQDGSLIEGRTRPVQVDAAAPQLEAGQVPARVAGELQFPLAVTDPGGAGVQSVTAYLRPAAGPATASGAAKAAAWTARPPERVKLDPGAGRIGISVADLPEGGYELFLQSSDQVGNQSQRPADGSTALAQFAIDRTPVAIRALPTALPWVEGLEAAVQVEMDLSDAVAPLWLEERAGDNWTQVLKWDTLAPGEELYRFPIPVGRTEYEVRFGIRDAVGNVSFALVGPRPVERAIRLVPLAGGQTLKAGANASLAWKVHPALGELKNELRAVVAHQPREDGEWKQVYDDLPATVACVWTVPPGDGEKHRVRVSLFHRGRLQGEDQSPPFAIVGSATPRIEPQVVTIGENSLYYSERAELLLETYRTGRAQYQKWFGEITAGLRRDARGALSAEELAKLPPDLRRQAAERERVLGEAAEKVRETFARALDLDARNYRAAYGMAQLLHRSSPDRSEEARRYLERTVEIKADHAAALNDLGASRILRGEHAAAEDALRRALAVEDAGAYHYNLALALFHQKKNAEAREHFEAALEKGGNAVKPGEVYYYIVAAFIEEGQAEEARRRLERYRQQIPAGLRESLASALRPATH